jgi:cytidylate kinase
MIIAIDGPAGAGKSTVSAALAERLGFQLIDTGALYRCVALVAQRDGISLDDVGSLERVAATLDAEFRFEGGRNRVLLAGEDVSGLIRTEAISDAASRVSAIPEVRTALLDLQRDLGRARDSVMEGRDIGTVVFPDAELKVFLTAHLPERARRRLVDYERVGREATLDEVAEEIATRDARDSERAAAPLKKADDALELDSSELGFEQVVAQVAALAERARLDGGRRAE